MYNDNVGSVDNVYIHNKLVYILNCCLNDCSGAGEPGNKARNL